MAVWWCPPQISGNLKVGSDGSVTFVEEDGIDYAPVTVQLPGGERVPFLFTVKELVAKGNLGQFGGDFTVPSYRGATFLDPKGRGNATGYDNAVALPAAADAEELLKENVKNTAALKGSAVFNVAKYDAQTGEVAGASYPSLSAPFGTSDFILFPTHLTTADSRLARRATCVSLQPGLGSWLTCVAGLAWVRASRCVRVHPAFRH